MTLRRLLRHPTGRVGLLLILLVTLVALAAPALAPFDPYNLDHRTVRRARPGGVHWLGTDAFGNDILSKLIYGARISLVVGLSTGIIVTLTGAAMGIAAGYLGGLADTLVMRTADILFVIPGLPLMIMLATYFGTRFYMIIIIFTILGWAGVARMIRSQVLSLKSQNYVVAAETAGATSLYVMSRHILPAVSPLLIVNGVLASAGVMVAEAGLSFLGFGDPVAVSWGKMLQEAQANHGLLFRAWWWIIPPGLAIFVTVLGFMLTGYALEEIFNPQVRRARMSQRLFRRLRKDPSLLTLDEPAGGGAVNA
ncbi:MAG: ABC transporter permease [Bacillota bacterium]